MSLSLSAIKLNKGIRMKEREKKETLGSS